MVIAYNNLMEEKEDDLNAIGSMLNEIDGKLNRLEERYAMEEITRDIYEKYTRKLREERSEIEAKADKMGKGVSNLDVCIRNAINFSRKLATVWDLSDYSQKQQLQFLLFPEGIYYNRKTEECRTPKVNEVFSYIFPLLGSSGISGG